MNRDLEKLQPYPFEKLNALKTGTTPPDIEHIALSIGEPKHATPDLITSAVRDNLNYLGNYPLTKGHLDLRAAICDWLQQRFDLPAGSLNPEQHALPVNGTREALFAFAQAVVDRSDNALVVSPNPFYQIYEGAAYLAGAEPYFVPCLESSNQLADFDQVDESVWQRCQLLFLCSPGNPTGAVIPMEQLQHLITLADKHNFVIASDECYSEIYLDEDKPPVGLLQAAAAMGNTNYKNCVVFHSLSKRSNAPGLRSGFVAGDAKVLEQFLRYRTYHGCAMSMHNQIASIAAWQDETHVVENRRLYREKFSAVLDILDGVIAAESPDAGFYLWVKTPISDEEFARGLFDQQNVTVLPGSYLSREVNGLNPGSGYVRMALVATLEECTDAANRITAFVKSLG